MALSSHMCPLKPGQTLSGTDSAGNLINDKHLGQVFEFEAVDPSTAGTQNPVTGRSWKAVVLRNTSGGALLGDRLGLLERTAGYAMCESVNGYSAVLATHGVVLIDPFLPAAGVADDDIFLGFISGPLPSLTPTVDDDMNGDIAVGAWLVAATAAGTTTTAGGRLSNVTLAGTTAGTASFNMAANAVGRALSAKTTANTNAAILVDFMLRI